MDGWVATAPNGPGSSVSKAAIVRSITGVDDETSGLADFFVGVGGRHDRRWSRRRSLRHVGRTGGGDGVDGTERVDELSGVGVGRRVASELGDDAHVDALTERPDEGDRQAVQLLREVQHEVPQAAGGLRLDRPCGAGEEVGFVVPLSFERGRDRGADANGLAPAQRFVAQPTDVVGIGETKLGVEVA